MQFATVFLVTCIKLSGPHAAMAILSCFPALSTVDFMRWATSGRPGWMDRPCSGDSSMILGLFSTSVSRELLTMAAYEASLAESGGFSISWREASDDREAEMLKGEPEALRVEWT